jgi:hypothetical protein
VARLERLVTGHALRAAVIALVLAGPGLAACAAAGGPAPVLVPATVRAVTVTIVPGLNGQIGPGLNGQKAPPAPVTVTSPDAVGGLVALINGLPPFPPGTYSCPADFEAGVRVTFLSAPHGKVLAEAFADTGGCGVVQLTVDGKQAAFVCGGPAAVGALSFTDLRWNFEQDQYGPVVQAPGSCP